MSTRPHLICWLALCGWLLVAGVGLAAFNVSVSPNPVTAGVEAQLILNSDQGQPVIPALPNIQGLTWISPRPAVNQTTRIVNGVRSSDYRSIYRFRIDQPGAINLPRFDVHVAGKTQQAGGFTIRAVENKVASQPVTELVKLKVTFDGQAEPPAQLYTGEMVHLVIDLQVDSRLEILGGNSGRSFVRPDNYFPDLALGDVLWRDYSAFNQHHRHFLYDDMEEKQVDGKRVRVFEYRAAFRPLEAGTITGAIRHEVPILVGGNNRDPFRNLMGQGGQIQQIPVSVPINGLEVLPLPPLPADEIPFLGLVGDWQVELALNASEVTLGDDLTLTMTIEGSGNIEALTVPKWNLPGFNVYEPEVERQVQRDSVSGGAGWVLVPRTVKSSLPPLAVRTFNPESGAFVTHRFTPELVIKPGQAGTISGPRIMESGEADTIGTLERPRRAAHDIIYIKDARGEPLRQPLWHHRLPLIVALLLAGPLVFIALLVLTGRRTRLGQDPTYRRRQEALRQRGRLRKRLRQASPEELPEVMRQAVVPHAAALLGLPPGTTIDELKRHLDDQELLELLESAQHGGFRPGTRQQIDRDRLLKALSRLGCLLLVLGLLSPSLAQAPAAPAPLTEASAAYDQGDFAAAAEIYRRQLEAIGPTAPLLYNLGNCAYAQGELGAAIARYEQARRLAPRDSAILENLNFVRSQLNLPPVRTIADPLSLARVWRDHLRPDEWLLMAALCWLIGWTLVGLARLLGGNWGRGSAALVAVIGILCLGAMYTQYTSTYRANQAVVVVDDAPVFRLPTATGDQPRLNLDEGEYVRLVERRTEWTRIRVGQVEGWVRDETVLSYW